jgi:hypothetical protein
MTIRLGILLGAAVMLVALTAAEAASTKAVPVIDLQVRCRKSEKTLTEMMGNNVVQAFDGCMTSERGALKALVDAWPKIPAAIKSYCIRPTEFSPSYVEWIACIEMVIDLRKQRATSDTRYAPVPGRCPSIDYANDGSIKSIRACSL